MNSMCKGNRNLSIDIYGILKNTLTLEEAAKTGASRGNVPQEHLAPKGPVPEQLSFGCGYNNGLDSSTCCRQSLIASPAEMGSFRAGVPTFLTGRFFLPDDQTLQLKLRSMSMRTATRQARRKLLLRQKRGKDPSTQVSRKGEAQTNRL